MDAARLRLADLIEVLSEPTLLSDERGRIQAANQPFRELAGYSAIDLSRLHADTILPRRALPLAAGSSSLPDPSPRRHLLCEDGEPLLVHVDNTEVPLDDGFLLIHSICPVQPDLVQPVPAQSAAGPAAERHVLRPPFWTQAQGRGTVLVVEPRPALRSVMLRVLTSVGYDAVGAEHVTEAESRIDEAPHYDLVIIEAVLPDGSGHELRRLIEQRTPATRVLMVSGAGPFDDGGARDDGPTPLFKPFSADGLIHAIHELDHDAARL